MTILIIFMYTFFLVIFFLVIAINEKNFSVFYFIFFRWAEILFVDIVAIMKLNFYFYTFLNDFERKKNCVINIYWCGKIIIITTFIKNIFLHYHSHLNYLVKNFKETTRNEKKELIYADVDEEEKTKHFVICTFRNGISKK